MESTNLIERKMEEQLQQAVPLPCSSEHELAERRHGWNEKTDSVEAIYGLTKVAEDRVDTGELEVREGVVSEQRRLQEDLVEEPAKQ